MILEYFNKITHKKTLIYDEKESKIVNINNIGKLGKNFKIKNKKIVLCHGVFDLLHIGHLKHFNSAKKFGDKLIVSITPDIYVSKGPGRPIFNQNLRAEFK